MSQKVCPRCGSQFATLKSATCPQCFAKLIEVDDEVAAEMSAERAKVEQTPEFQQTKAEEDERFRHQSFQACLGVIGLTLITAIVVVSAIVSAKRHESSLRGDVARVRASTEKPSSLPQADVGDVMPAVVGPFHREKMDEEPAVSGTLTLIYHAAYRRTPPDMPMPMSHAVDDSDVIDVYALALSRPAAEQAHFRDLMKLLANAGSQHRDVNEVVAKPFLYEILISSGTNANDFRAAWAKVVGA